MCDGLFEFSKLCVLLVGSTLASESKTVRRRESNKNGVFIVNTDLWECVCYLCEDTGEFIGSDSTMD